jgi:asparagine synthase (glutamine-hydrolysing)
MEVGLRDEMLPKSDRAGMAFGLEARVPLLDDEVVEAMLEVPLERHAAPPQGKALLRSWAAEALPGIDWERPKHGFDVPMVAWLRGGLREDADRLLLRPAGQGLTEAGAARALWDRMLAGSPNAAHSVYAALVAELWFERRGAALP